MQKSVAHAEALTTHHDDRGSLTELIHCYDLPQKSPKGEHGPTFGQYGQTYIVRNEQVGTIRAFHKHERQWDYFTVVNGKAQVWVVTPEEDRAERFILSGANLTRLTIPPHWWHGWESLMPNTILVSTITDVYDRNDPDEERISHLHFSNLNIKWGVTPY
jgi:dTDP-4-dehydrorhamnose 3,5-epimerase